MRTITATEPSALDVVTDVIHDAWFDVDEVTFEDGQVRVPFTVRRAIFRSAEPDAPRSSLLIRHVTALDLEDTQGIGRYDFNRLRFDENAGRLSIDSGIPLRFEMLVEDLEVSVLFGDPVGGER